jgi:hypothetical protein
MVIDIASIVIEIPVFEKAGRPGLPPLIESPAVDPPTEQAGNR